MSDCDKHECKECGRFNKHMGCGLSWPEKCQHYRKQKPCFFKSKIPLIGQESLEAMFK
ncbi:MAG: hypothetical protein ACXADO_10060 [Candidatus Thorarchaeota archaeon]|jgi:hypothetical protein